MRKLETFRGMVFSTVNRCGTYPKRNPGFRKEAPELGSTAPINDLMNVVLPDPFGPTMTTISPGVMLKFMLVRIF